MHRRLILTLAVLLVLVAVLWWRAPQLAPGDERPETADAPRTEPEPSVWSRPQEVSPDNADHEERPRPPKREGVDAANLYADAFVLFDRLTDEEKAMLRKPGEEVDAEKAAQLWEKIQAILELLRAAAKAGYCDWGTGEITIETSLPHIGKAQSLGQLALWAAGYRFATDPVGAIDDLGVRARLGHHLSDTVIGMLVSGSFEAGASNLLRSHMGSFDATTTRQALAFIENSTLDGDLTRAMQGEISIADAIGRKLADMSAAERLKMVTGFSGDGEMTAEQFSIAERFRFALGETRWLETEIDRIRSIEEKAAGMMRLPDADFQSWWKNLEREFQNRDSLAALVVPSLAGVQRTVQQRRVERTLLTAAADVLQGGPAQIGRYRDPATGGPLQYVPTSTGFELRSPYLVKGKPVTMSFRTAPTE